MPEEGGFSFQDYATSIGLQVLLTVVLQPLDLAEFLMQIGHHPIPGYPKSTLIGLKNSFKYVGYIKSRDGFFGCYRGVLSRIRSRIMSSTVVSVFLYYSPPDDDSEDLSISRYLSTILRETVEITLAVFASQPFIVISWRVMGQFVGEEQIYSSFFWSIYEIYTRSGIAGFFTGLIPRWLGEATGQALGTTICYLVDCYLITDPLLRASSSIIIRYMCFVFTYPLTVAAVCFGVNDCGLACGQPPEMPIFLKWTEAFEYAINGKQLKKA